MNSGNLLVPKLNPQYFWDVDLACLNESADSRLIIERVFSLGEPHEMNEVIRFYGKNEVVEVLCNLSYIDPKSFNFITKLFNKPRKEFRCYKRMQSKPQRWSS
jgi:hypothetical protein